MLAIPGLKIHFLRSPAKPKSANVKVIPLMLIHGWPGSFVEFLYTIPLLNEARDDIAFDVVVPSIPGYGFSDPPSRHGIERFMSRRISAKTMSPSSVTKISSAIFLCPSSGVDCVVTARISEKLMARLGYSRHLVQVGLGSAITASMGTHYPEE